MTNMGDDKSSDVIITIDDDDDDEAMDLDEPQTENKPIKQLFIELFEKGYKQYTVLSNEALIMILQKEFDMDITDMHVLEVDIYMNVIKQLKDWPHWDEFDKNMTKLKENNDIIAINKLIDEKYKSLKDYLKIMLNVAEPMAKNIVKTIDECVPSSSNVDTRDTRDIEEGAPSSSKDTRDIVMEVQCSRSQLNQLIYRHPHPDLNNTIFNIADAGPLKISLHSPNYESILNWWDVSIHINLNCLYFRRETVHEFKHVLVNKKLDYSTEPTEFNRCFQEKASSKAAVQSKNNFIHVLDKIALKFSKGRKDAEVIDILFNLIKKDLRHAPENLKIPASYRKYCSNYSYIRYLYTDVKVDPDSENAKKYDLQLEETISPMYQFYIGKVWNDFKLNKGNVSTSIWSRDRVRIECKSCKESFYGQTMLEKLHMHFFNKHQPRTLEPEWYCSNCKKVFTCAFLTSHRWYHKCVVKSSQESTRFDNPVN